MQNIRKYLCTQRISQDIIDFFFNRDFYYIDENYIPEFMEECQEDFCRQFKIQAEDYHNEDYQNFLIYELNVAVRLQTLQGAWNDFFAEATSICITPPQCQAKFYTGL